MKSIKLLTLLTTLALTACDMGGRSSAKTSSDGPYSGTDSDCLPKISEVSSYSSSEDPSSKTLSSSEKSFSSESSTTVSSSEIKSSSTVVSSSSKEQSSSITSSSSTIQSTGGFDISSANPSSSSQQQSSSATSSSSKEDSSEQDIFENGYKINFVNPSCGSFSKEVLNDRLKEYINETVGFTFVSSITSNDSQIGNGFPTTGNKILIIGASSTTGSIAMTFTTNVQAIRITAQTYYKPYTLSGVEYPNVDPNSVLCITAGTTSELDLTPVNGQAVEKSFSEAIQTNKLTLSSKNDSKGRVYIKDITFVL